MNNDKLDYSGYGDVDFDNNIEHAQTQQYMGVSNEHQYNAQLSAKVAKITKSNHRFTLNRKSADGSIWFFLDEELKVYSIPAYKLEK